MKLVLDTNIFISAFYWGGNPLKIIERVFDGMDKLFVSDEILNEIAGVMAGPKFKTPREIIGDFITSIEKYSEKIPVSGKIKGVCRDKDDDDKIECAILSGADFLVTGDNDLLVIKNYQTLKIITIDDYLKLINYQRE